jgi:hypothetical protein
MFRFTCEEHVKPTSMITAKLENVPWNKRDVIGNAFLFD